MDRRTNPSTQTFRVATANAADAYLIMSCGYRSFRGEGKGKEREGALSVCVGGGGGGHAKGGRCKGRFLGMKGTLRGLTGESPLSGDVIIIIAYFGPCLVPTGD